MLGDKKDINIEANLVIGESGSVAVLPTLGVGWRFFF
jgi:hypothetical protein